MPPPGELSASSSLRSDGLSERTWVDPLHAIGICIVAADAETVGPGYVAAVESSDIASCMQVIPAHSWVCDDCMRGDEGGEYGEPCCGDEEQSV